MSEEIINDSAETETPMTADEKTELDYFNKWQANNKEIVKKWVKDLMDTDIPVQFVMELPAVLRSLLNVVVTSSTVHKDLVKAKNILDKTEVNKLYEQTDLPAEIMDSPKTV